MTIVRFDPVREIDDLRQEVNRVFGAMPMLSTPLRADRWLPALDVVEQDRVLHVTIDLPGMSDQDIDVEVQDDLLYIRGHREIERTSDEGMWHRHERSSGEFERCLQLPDGVDPATVAATFDRGVLTVTVPIPEPVEPAGRHIQITSASS